MSVRGGQKRLDLNVVGHVHFAADHLPARRAVALLAQRQGRHRRRRLVQREGTPGASVRGRLGHLGERPLHAEPLRDLTRRDVSRGALAVSGVLHLIAPAIGRTEPEEILSTGVGPSRRRARERTADLRRREQGPEQLFGRLGLQSIVCNDVEGAEAAYIGLQSDATGTGCIARSRANPSIGCTAAPSTRWPTFRGQGSPSSSRCRSERSSGTPRLVRDESSANGWMGSRWFRRAAPTKTWKWPYRRPLFPHRATEPGPASDEDRLAGLEVGQNAYRRDEGVLVARFWNNDPTEG